MQDRENLPQITIKDRALITADSENHSYFLINNNQQPSGLTESEFRVIKSMGEKPNHLVYTQKLVEVTDYYYRASSLRLVSGEQYMAEMMHDLSQPDLLGNLLKPETYGSHIVGYRLAAEVALQEEIEDRIPPALNKIPRIFRIFRTTT